MEVQKTNTIWRSFMSVTSGWSQHHHSPSPSPAPSARRISHLRSLSNKTSPTVNTFSAAVKPRSNSHIPMAADGSPPATPQNKQRVFAGISEDDLDMTTIPDPRSRSITPLDMDGSQSPDEQPELRDEVTTLSSKLIQAINHQTTLDDNLSQTRDELNKAREQIRSMEIQLQRQKDMIAEEKRLRLGAEQEKKRIEQELENLSIELFEEANRMVIAAKEEARQEQDVVQRKSDLLRAQLVDTEGLLKSQQEQLVELKQVMEQMHADRDDQTATTTPSSPGYSKFDSRDDDTPTSEVGSHVGLSELMTPANPTSFTHLLQPVLRNDIIAYQDFVNLCETSRRVSSRPPSGTHSSLGLGLIGSAASASSIGLSSSASTASLSSVGSPAAYSTFSPQTPNTPASTQSGASAMSMVPIPPLKETKFYKRVLTEDIEPTLRLDIAPGLSWLARRSVIAAMSDGSLVVEPVPTTGTYALLSKPQFHSCSLCGENRKEDQYLRRYRFRISESTSAQRYPLCSYCLGRVRATCDFLGFLRIVKDGHWRTDDEDSEKTAWEESVRLRESMFWTRIGGGVRPILQGFHGHPHSIDEKSPRLSGEDITGPAESVIEPIHEAKPLEHDLTREGSPEDLEMTEDEFATPVEELASEGTASIGTESLQETEDNADVISVVVHDESATEVSETSSEPVETVPEPPRTPEPTDNNRLSSQSTTPKSSDSKQISIKIPGSF